MKHPGALWNFYLRLKKREGHKIAIIAAARKLLTIIWAMLSKNAEYRYLKEDLRQKKIRRMNKKALSYVSVIIYRKKLPPSWKMKQMWQKPPPAA